MYYLNLEFQRHSHSPDKIININSVSQIKATTGLVQKSTFYSLALSFLSCTRKTSFSHGLSTSSAPILLLCD